MELQLVTACKCLVTDNLVIGFLNPVLAINNIAMHLPLSCNSCNV